MPLLLSNINLWERHKERVCEVIFYALVLLQGKSNLVQDEDELNREFYFCLLEANQQLYEQGRGVSTPFYLEARKQPSPKHRGKHDSENTRPDFQNGLIDHTEVNPHKQIKVFHIECKRLGDSPSRTWVLNTEYSVNGIARFLSENHQYGGDVDSGAMVGYVESSEFKLILEEVNKALLKAHPNLSQLISESEWDTTKANLLEHSLHRNFPASPFILKHFWIDFVLAP